ncbi:phosphoribosylglycinamide formyltransferase [Luteimonas vadosa]|uniref:Phosphoribosylglycinamide formyltransferase n=1 Tax=Luteimonas vadosa TaxID=1165507 RepID=A0ABP9DV75_9GAMM
MPPDVASGASECPRIAVLASGRGTNLQALLDAIADGRLRASISGVFSDRSGAPVLERARDAGVPACAMDPARFDSRRAFDLAMFDAVAASGADFVVCAGYLRLLDEVVVERWRGRMVNIHPSLLPAYKGLRTHQRALDDGIDMHGASVHFVTPDLDGGPVLAQVRVPVLPGDDARTLAARVLEREHPLLVACVDMIAQGTARLVEDGVMLEGVRLLAPLQLAANNTLA